MRAHAVFTALGFVSVLLFASDGVAEPVYSEPITDFPASRDVFCGETRCGTMTIDDYFAVEGTIKGVDVQGVRIKGDFTQAISGTFHFLQVAIEDSLPPKFIDGSDLPIPYVDTPPGGYQNDPFDLLPYYDEGEFPEFVDEPFNSLGLIQAAGVITVKFETWLVCVIDEQFGADLDKAQDDFFDLAPLLGWEWGLESTFNGLGANGVLDFSDVDTVALDFRFITGSPSADWLTGLDQVYGENEDEDRFNVEVGDCEGCGLPEPAGLGLPMIVVLVALGVAARRRERFADRRVR
jgi:hypothetical protein